MRAFSLCLALAFTAALTSRCSHKPSRLPGDPALRAHGEVRLGEIRQLTQGGWSNRPRWSFEGDTLALQHAQHTGPTSCDQSYLIGTDGKQMRLISPGKGLATDAAFLPDDRRVLFSSTHGAGDECPAPSPLAGAQVMHASHQIYSVKTEGEADILPLEPGQPRAYNAEAATCKDGSVIFTSDRDGDLELYRAKLDRLGTLGEVTRITRSEGYEGGAAFSPDCSQIAWHAWQPRTPQESAAYKALLRKHLYRPTTSEIWIANADGSHPRQLTRLNALSVSPSFSSDGKRVVFASSARPGATPGGSKLHAIRTDGAELEQVTFSDTIEGAPAFSPDGATLAFVSNRAADGKTTPGMNLFLADWTETAPIATPTPAPAPTATLEGAKPWGWTWGKACGRVAPIVVGASRGATNALIEITRLVGEAGLSETRACLVFVGVDENDANAAPQLAALLNKLKVRPKAMLLLGETGTLEDNHLIVRGSDTARAWTPLVAQACKQERLTCDAGPSGLSRPGFVQPFLDATLHVPLLYATTGPRPAMQTGENVTGQAQASHALASIAVRAVRAPLAYNRRASELFPPAPSSTPSPIPSPSPSTSADVVDLKAVKAQAAYLGLIPDYAMLAAPRPPGEAYDGDSGVRLAKARPGSPAALAGVQEKDTLMGVALPPGGKGERILKKTRTLDSYMSVLASLRPGDEIVLYLRRGAQDLILPIQVGKRE